MKMKSIEMASSHNVAYPNNGEESGEKKSSLMSCNIFEEKRAGMFENAAKHGGSRSGNVWPAAKYARRKRQRIGRNAAERNQSSNQENEAGGRRREAAKARLRRRRRNVVASTAIRQ